MRSLGAIALLLVPAAGLTQAPAARFGAREAVEQASLSPDGSKLAYLGHGVGQGSALFVAPLTGGSEPKPIYATNGDPDRIQWCRWASNERLLCSLYGVVVLPGGDITYASRLIALDGDGKNAKLIEQRGGSGQSLGYGLFGGSVIDWLPDENGSVLMMRAYVPEESTGTMLSQSRSGIGVDKVDTRKLSSSPVEPPRDTASEYITDGRGKVRIMGLTQVDNDSGYTKGTTRYQYRKKNSRDWLTLSTVDEHGAGFNPYGVDGDLDVAYGLKRLNGRFAAYKVALDGSMTETLVFAHPEVDVDGFVRVGRRGRIIGVSYATEKRQAHYFDPPLEKLKASLSKAMPNQTGVNVVDSSLDESKLLLWTGSDTDPGRYYLFDRTAKQLTPLMDSRPDLAGVPLAPVRPMTYKAADGTSIPAYLTLPPGKDSARGLPAIVMPHGGPESRDEWGFDWLPQFFANRGYAVLQPNFRGSSGYGDAWFEKNGFQSWRTAIGDIDDGGRWLISQGVDPKQLGVVGWSYGGYAALQSAATEPGLFKAVVAIAPVTDLDRLKEERRYWSEFQVVSRYIGSGAHIEEGSPARNAGKIKAPVLMFHGTLDRNVRVSHSRLMQDRLKDAGGRSELVTFDKLDHYLEDPAARTQMLAKADAFLKSALGASDGPSSD